MPQRVLIAAMLLVAAVSTGVDRPPAAASSHTGFHGLHPPTAEAVRALLISVRDVDPDLFTFLKLGASTGARRSQLFGLRWGEVDFAHSAVGIARAFVEGVEGPVLRATKNRRSYRVAIDAGTLGVLVVHWRRAVVAAAHDESKLTVKSFAFSRDSDGGRPWLPNHVTKRFIVHRRQAGLAEFRLHDLRHFMATEMLARGVPVPTVSQRLGHARASTTLNVYAHRVPGADREAATLVGALLDPSLRPAPRSHRPCRWCDKGADPADDEKLHGGPVGSDALYREAMGLPDDEGATLAVRLLASVDEPTVDDSVESYTAWLREIEQRLDALVSGEDPGEDWDDVYKDLVADCIVE